MKRHLKLKMVFAPCCMCGSAGLCRLRSTRSINLNGKKERRTTWEGGRGGGGGGGGGRRGKRGGGGIGGGGGVISV